MSVPFPPSSRIPAAAALSAASLPRRVRETLEAVHALAFELIVDPLDRLIPELEARLTHLQDRGAQHTVSVSYLAQAQILQRRQAGFIAAFMQGIDRELAHLRDQARSSTVVEETAPAMPSFDELRLVEEDEEDEATEVRAIAMRQEARAALPLQLLCQRFAVLAESPAFDVATVPLGPRRLCELLIEAAEANGFSLSLRVALLREFDRRVLAEYPGITEAANDLLARLRIMPGLSYVPLRPRPRTAPASTDTAVAEQDRPLTGWTSGASAEADSVTFQLLQELLAARRSIADRFRASSEALGRSRLELDTAEVLGLLDQADAAVARQDIESIRQWVLLQARRERGQAVALGPQDTDTFELLGLMYGHLLRDVRPEPATIALLDALKLPLLRVALADASFFVRSTHPARELLNAVAESSARWYQADDVDPQLHAHLQRAVGEVAAARGEPTAAFRGAMQSLETQWQTLTRRADIAERRNVEAARGKEKLAVARQRATAVIEEALAGVRVPVFHRGMLRQAWADVLTLGHLRHGEQGADWLELVDSTHELVRAAGGGAPTPGLAAHVEQWLVTVGYHADDAGRIARLLAGDARHDEDEAATRTELALKLKGRARLGEDALPDTSHLPPMTDAERAAFERLRALPPGTWLELPGGTGVLRRRLSWASPVTGHALFVNLRGQRVGESTLDELARQLAAGQARVVTAADARLVDRAWRAALQSLGTSQRPPGDEA